MKKSLIFSEGSAISSLDGSIASRLEDSSSATMEGSPLAEDRREKMDLKERRQKIISALKDITEGFVNIEDLLSPRQKRNMVIKGLGKNVNLRYFPVKGVEEILATYTDKEGNTYGIKINYEHKVK